LRYLPGRFPAAKVMGASRRAGKRRGGVACDLESLSSVRRAIQRAKPDLIFHAAGTTQAGSWEKLVRSHVDTTVNLLEAVRLEQRPIRVVVIGSAAEYGRAGESRARISETVAPRPDTPYGVSKYMQSKIALGYAEIGMDVIVARLFNLFAPDAPSHFAVAKFAGALRSLGGRGPHLLAMGPLDGVRDYVGVEDALEALTLLSQRGKSGEIYNVCSGIPRRMGDLFISMATRAGKVVRLRTGPLSGARSATRRCVGDPRKLKRETGWRPRIDIGLIGLP
jgi:GDP-4-dehydro-6-deoxy-D-mannose reductase